MFGRIQNGVEQFTRVERQNKTRGENNCILEIKTMGTCSGFLRSLLNNNVTCPYYVFIPLQYVAQW